LITSKQAESDTFKNIQNKQSLAFQNLKSKLGLNAKQLINFIKAKVIREYQSGAMVIGIDGLTTTS
jgi:hypothetical protein